jgi:hypothetical protein
LICVTSSRAVEDRQEDRLQDRPTAAEFVKRFAGGGKVFVEILERPRGWRRLIGSGLRPGLS